MKTLSSAMAIVLAFLLSSCGRFDNNADSIPSPVQSNETASLLPTKRYSETILNELYQDESSKSPELQKLNKEISTYNREIEDSLASVDKYLQYSTSYYSAAGYLAKSVKDSILQKRLQELISKSEALYNKETEKLKSIVSSINKTEVNINDYQLALKLIVTLPIIENYQKENLPAAIKKIDKVAIKGQKLKGKTFKAAERY